jgi:hypothetical protein
MGEVFGTINEAGGAVGNAGHVLIFEAVLNGDR